MHKHFKKIHPNTFIRNEIKTQTQAVVLVDPISSGEHFKPTAKQLNYSVIALYTISYEDIAAGYYLTEDDLFEDCDVVIFSDDKNAILKILRSLPFKIQGIVPTCEPGIEIADFLIQQMKFFGNDVEFSTAHRDKGVMRNFIKKAGLSCPDFEICSKETEVVHFAKKHHFPLVLKTPQGASSNKVFICHNLEELKKAFHATIHKPDLYGHTAKYVILEEYLFGAEYFVDLFSDGDKIHVTDVWIYDKRDTGQYKNLVYSAVLIELPHVTVKPIITYAIKVAEVLGIRRGPSHVEIKDDPKRGPTLIEIAARLCGARIPEVVQEYSNFDIYKGTIEVFLKGIAEVPQPITISKHIAVTLCPIVEEGKVKKVEGIKEIQQLHSYLKHSLRLKKGDVLHASSELASVPLFVYLVNSDFDQLQKDIKAVHGLFKIEVTDG